MKNKLLAFLILFSGVFSLTKANAQIHKIQKYIEFEKYSAPYFLSVEVVSIKKVDSLSKDPYYLLTFSIKGAYFNKKKTIGLSGDNKEFDKEHFIKFKEEILFLYGGQKQIGCVILFDEKSKEGKDFINGKYNNRIILLDIAFESTPCQVNDQDILKIYSILGIILINKRVFKNRIRRELFSMDEISN